jgi:hypothetical protein
MASDGHVLIVGQTMSGKTICAQRLSHNYRAHHIKVAVLDPMRDPKWQADFITDDPAEFMELVRNPLKCQSCALFVDESGQVLDRYSVDFNWLTCQSRHHGHVAHIIAQRAQQVSMTIRSQCSTIYAFNVNNKDAKEYADAFNSPALLECPNLPQGHCIRVKRFCTPERLRMW